MQPNHHATTPTDAKHMGASTYKTNTWSTQKWTLNLDPTCKEKCHAPEWPRAICRGQFVGNFAQSCVSAYTNRDIFLRNCKKHRYGLPKKHTLISWKWPSRATWMDFTSHLQITFFVWMHAETKPNNQAETRSTTWMFVSQIQKTLDQKNTHGNSQTDKDTWNRSNSRSCLKLLRNIEHPSTQPRKTNMQTSPKTHASTQEQTGISSTEKQTGISSAETRLEPLHLQKMKNNNECDDQDHERRQWVLHHHHERQQWMWRPWPWTTTESVTTMTMNDNWENDKHDHERQQRVWRPSKEQTGVSSTKQQTGESPRQSSKLESRRQRNKLEFPSTKNKLESLPQKKKTGTPRQRSKLEALLHRSKRESFFGNQSSMSRCEQKKQSQMKQTPGIEHAQKRPT